MSDNNEIIQVLTTQISQQVSCGVLVSKLIVFGLRSLLEKQFYRIWQKVTLGEENIRDIVEALEQMDRISSWNNKKEHAIQTLLTSPSSSARVQVSVVLLQPRDLGFMESVSVDALLELLKEFGLIRCPLELVPLLRLRYLDQPKGFANDVLVITEPITSEYESPVLGLRLASEYFVLRNLDEEMANMLKKTANWSGVHLQLGGILNPEQFVALAVE